MATNEMKTSPEPEGRDRTKKNNKKTFETVLILAAILVMFFVLSKLSGDWASKISPQRPETGMSGESLLAKEIAVIENGSGKREVLSSEDAASVESILNEMEWEYATCACAAKARLEIKDQKGRKHEVNCCPDGFCEYKLSKNGFGCAHEMAPGAEEVLDSILQAYIAYPEWATETHEAAKE